MKGIAVILNTISLGFIVWLLYDNGMPKNEEGWFILILIGANVTSLIAILKSQFFSDNSFIGLWLQRKKLEEQQKINKLNSQKD